jgi:hypothetical protein
MLGGCGSVEKIHSAEDEMRIHPKMSGRKGSKTQRALRSQR